jgi:predicted phage gp36 major capsid-like protein
METMPLGKKEQKSERVMVMDYTKGELKAETEKMDREIEEANRHARINAEREAKQKRELEESQNRKVLREINRLRMHLDKPTMSGFVAMNMKSGKTRKVKQGEFKPLVIDYSDPSLEDGDLVVPEQKEVKTNVK